MSYCHDNMAVATFKYVLHTADDVLFLCQTQEFDSADIDPQAVAVKL